MNALIAFVLAAAAVQPAPQDHSAGTRVSALATVEILRGETASEEAGPDGLKRQVRPRANGQVAIEFE